MANCEDTVMAGNKTGVALIIDDFWGKIISAVMVAFILGGTSYAVTAYGQSLVIQRQLADIHDAHLPDRTTRLEQDNKYIIEAQRKNGDKLDLVLKLLYATKK